MSVEHVKAKMAEILNSLTEHDLQNALNIGSIVCSCVPTQKGTILKAIVVHFLNMLNGKSYRQNLVRVRVCMCVCVCARARIYIYMHQAQSLHNITWSTRHIYGSSTINTRYNMQLIANMDQAESTEHTTYHS